MPRQGAEAPTPVGLSHIANRIAADITQEERGPSRWRSRPTRSCCCPTSRPAA